VKVLVTGSSGFVGRHLAESWVEDGADVTCVDVRDAVSAVDALDFFRSDTTRFDLLVHCAAIVGGRANIEGDPLAVATNLALDSWAFRWASRHAERVVYFSSSAAYPVELQTRAAPASMLAEWMINLDQPRTPDATYGLAKLTGEQLAAEADSWGLPVHVFRPFSGYGWDQDLDYPFPAFVQRACRGDDPFTVWGDGTQTRDFVHISDVVGAVRAAVNNDVRGPVNLCTGVATSFLDLAALCLRKAGSLASVETLPDKPAGCWRRVGDPSRLLEFYTPAVTLEQGVAESIGTLRFLGLVDR